MLSLVFSSLVICVVCAISGIHSSVSSIYFYPTQQNLSNLSYIPEVIATDAISLFAHTLQCSKRSPILSNSAMKLLNTFVDSEHAGHHVMVRVPGMRSGDAEFPLTMTINHDESFSSLYKSIGKQRNIEFGAETEDIQNIAVTELDALDFQTESIPLLKMIHVNDVSDNSPEYAEKVQAIHNWIRKRQEQHPEISFSLITPTTQLHLRDLTENCYTSHSQCETETNTCHGQGTCITYDNCFRCQCNKNYGGDSCMYKDWTVEIALFGGVTIVWIAAIGLSIVLLLSASNIGNIGMASNTRSD